MSLTKTILHDVDGTPVRYYHVDVPNASAIHPILPSINTRMVDRHRGYSDTTYTGDCPTPRGTVAFLPRRDDVPSA